MNDRHTLNTKIRYSEPIAKLHFMTKASYNWRLNFAKTIWLAETKNYEIMW